MVALSSCVDSYSGSVPVLQSQDFIIIKGFVYSGPISTLLLNRCSYTEINSSLYSLKLVYGIPVDDCEENINEQH